MVSAPPLSRPGPPVARSGRPAGPAGPVEPAGEPPARRTALAAAASVVLASTALSSVVLTLRWLGFVVVAVAVVSACGMLLRSLRAPSPVVAVGELGGLACLLTAVFTRSGALGVLPGPAALGELRTVLLGAFDQVQSGVPPVEPTTEILCLVTVALGLAAVVVDLLAVSAAAPAACGLVLLAVFAVPAALADDLLPWWSFVAAAVGFGLLLGADGRRRQLAWRACSRLAAVEEDSAAAPVASVVTAAAVVAALIVGSAATVLGTAGRLSGSGPGDGSGTAQIGLNPFTSLRGALQRNGVVTLFRVRGLPQPTYLKALTLTRYAAQQGWLPPERQDPRAVPLGADLAASGDRTPPGQPVTVSLDNVGYRDSWLPLYGVPLGVSGLTGRWQYDSGAQTAFTSRPRQERSYLERAVLPQPSAGALRAAGPATGVDPAYTDTRGLDARVSTIADQVTAAARTPFDKAVALSSWFTAPTNGFTYSLATRPGNSGDALVDFLTNGKTGYCEQFASAMAIMLRAVGVPARVAIGFTPGFESGGVRVITTQDAHAWVEAWFPGFGWTTFDPTPLADGRTVVPSYVTEAASTANAGSGQSQDDQRAAAPPDGNTPTVARSPDDSGPQTAGGATGDGSGGPPWWPIFPALVAVAALAAPALARAGQRRRRLRLVAAAGPDAAPAAWQELVAESWDRGIALAEAETVRAGARRLVREHGLDAEGRDAVRVVVGALERSWYAPAARMDAVPIAVSVASLAPAVDQVRASLLRCAPLSWGSRLLPRSVLHPPRRAVRVGDQAAAAHR